MSLTLYMHPLSSFCQKVIIALYENNVPFTPRLVDLRDPMQRDALGKLWPLCKLPLLRDEARGQTVPESTMIIEYLTHHHRGPAPLIPEDPETAFKVRLTDRFYDLYVNGTMSKVVTDRLRPLGGRDEVGVAAARGQLRTALQVAEKTLAAQPWAAGEVFSMADCAAAPALFYSDRIMQLARDFPHVRAYLDRLLQRPSCARAFAEAAPYLHMFPADQTEGPTQTVAQAR
jgi:glutathione S-transferase